MKRFVFISLLVAAIMIPRASAEYPFRDIDPTHWAYRSLKSLYDAGIIKGDGTGLFKGNEKISRFEAASMLNNAMQYMARMRSTGGNFDADMMDTMNALMTEFADEMMIMEVRIEENSNAISAIRNQLSYMHGRPNQGVVVPLGQNGRLRIMGQAQFSYVMGGKNHHSYSTDKTLNDPTAAGADTAEGVSEFLVDHAALGFAADIDEKTSFYTRANMHMGGDSSRNRDIMNVPGVPGGPINNQPIAGSGITAGGDVGPGPGVAFDDYMYFHVKNLWSDWDMSLGRIGVPWGHETAGMFRTNPYFVTNSMVHETFSGLMDGAYFSKEARTGELYYGFGLHNGDLRPNPEYYWSHTYNTGFSNPVAAINYSPMHISSYARNLNGSASGANRDNGHGYVAHIGGRTRDGDLKWDLSYFSNGGSLKKSTAHNFAGQSAISFLNLGADYRINRDWHMSLEYVSGDIEAAGHTALNLSAINPITPTIANVVSSDSYTAWYTQFVHHLDVKSTLALRYGVFEFDREVAAGTAARDDSVKELTLAYGRSVSDNGRMILEYSKPTVDTAYGAVVANSPKSDLMRATYRMDF